VGAGRVLQINTAVDSTYGGGLYDNLILNTLSIIKSGTGALTLSGANTYTGTTVISGGSLIVTGSLASGSAVTVKNGGTLKGTGTVSGAVTMESGGSIGPGLAGTAIGQLNTNAVTFVAGSVYSVNLNGTTPTFDKINSGNTVNCGGGTLTVASIVNSVATKVYTIIGATTVSNTFNGLANNALITASGRSLKINYTGTTVTLTDMGGYSWFLKQDRNGLYNTMQLTNGLR
jgi:autotransporter-associated beta strand protein